MTSETNLSTFSQEYITKEDLSRHIAFLASDSLKGRKSFSIDEFAAAQYISKKFEEYGLKPMLHGKSPFLQTFYRNGGFSIDTIRLHNINGDNFILPSNSAIGDFEFNNEKGQLFFESINTDTSSNSGFKDLKGKFLVIFDGAEKEAKKMDKFHHSGESLRRNVEAAIKSNAKGILSFHLTLRDINTNLKYPTSENL